MSVTQDPTLIKLEKGQTQEIVTKDQAERGIPYLVQIQSDNGVRYAHDKRNAERGIELSGQQTHTLSNFRGQGVYVVAHEGPTELRVRPAGADLETQPKQKVRIEEDVSVAQSQNRNGLVSFSQSVNDPLPSFSVPDGIDVLIQADILNQDPIKVGEVSLLAGNGISLSVNDPSVITVDGPTGNEINVIFED